MYFIIIHSIYFDDFLSVNIMLNREKKRYDVFFYIILSLDFKNDKKLIKQLKTDVQVK